MGVNKVREMGLQGNISGHGDTFCLSLEEFKVRALSRLAIAVYRGDPRIHNRKGCGMIHQLLGQILMAMTYWTRLVRHRPHYTGLRVNISSVAGTHGLEVKKITPFTVSWCRNSKTNNFLEGSNSYGHAWCRQGYYVGDDE